MAEPKKAAPADKFESLHKAIAAKEKALDEAKDAFIRAGEELEEARTKYQDAYSDESEKSQVEATR